MVNPTGWKRFLFRVVDHQGKRFKLFQVYFDDLPAMDEFLGGQIRVYRNDFLFDQTSSIGEAGTHAPVTVFSGFKHITAPWGGPVGSRLNPESLEVGDAIVLSLPAEAQFELYPYLRYRAAAHQAWDEERERSSKVDFNVVRQRVEQLLEDETYPPDGMIIH